MRGDDLYSFVGSYFLPKSLVLCILGFAVALGAIGVAVWVVRALGV